MGDEIVLKEDADAGNGDVIEVVGEQLAAAEKQWAVEARTNHLEERLLVARLAEADGKLREALLHATRHHGRSGAASDGTLSSSTARSRRNRRTSPICLQLLRNGTPNSGAAHSNARGC